MKKIIIETDGIETTYDSLTEAANAIGVSIGTLSNCASYGYKCHGISVRYADGTRRIRRRGKAREAVPAERLVELMAEWYIGEWRDYISSDALVSLVDYIKANW